MLLYYHGQLLWVTLEAVDCHIHSVRYDMAVNSGAGGRLRWPHQVTYDVAATPIHPNNA